MSQTLLPVDPLGRRLDRNEARNPSGLQSMLRSFRKPPTRLCRAASRWIAERTRTLGLSSLPSVVFDGLPGSYQDPLQYRKRSAPPSITCFRRPRFTCPLSRTPRECRCTAYSYLGRRTASAPQRTCAPTARGVRVVTGAPPPGLPHSFRHTAPPLRHTPCSTFGEGSLPAELIPAGRLGGQTGSIEESRPGAGLA